MSKIDKDKFIISLIDNYQGYIGAHEIYSALIDQGLTYEGDEIVPIDSSAQEPKSDQFSELKKSEDERIRKNCIHFLELQKPHHAATFEIEECIAWLEKKDEQKWSDEDEELLQHCCGAVAAADYYTLEDKEEMENWLKSLKQRNL